MDRAIVKEVEGLTFATQHVGPISAACTLIYDKASDSLAIVDPGGDAKLVINTVRKLRGDRKGPIAHSMILLTHARLPPHHVIPHNAFFSHPTPSQSHKTNAQQILTTRLDCRR